MEAQITENLLLLRRNLLASPFQNRLMPNGPIARFGPFELDLEAGVLRKRGVRIQLQPKSFLVLRALLERPGTVVGRDELRSELWPADTFVEFEASLNVAVRRLRVALCDDAQNIKYIETIPREGYRFVANVERILAAEHSSPPAFSSTLDSSPMEPPVDVHRRGWVKRTFLAAGTAVICIALLGLAISSPTIRRMPQKNPSRKRMIIVLPFDNLSGDATQEYISDGLTEELSMQLGNVNSAQLGVIGRTSAMTYKHSHRSIRTIGKELGVDYVLEGSVRRDTNRVRVTAQLVEVSSQAHIWSANYDQDFYNLLQLEGSLASEIARHVGVSIAIDQTKKSAKPHTPNPEAHDAYLRGRYYWYKRNTEGWKSAENYFRVAINKDPDYAAAYAGLAECQISNVDAQAAALKAISLDPTSAEAYTALGWVELYGYLDPTGARPAFQKAIELAPNYAQAHYSYAGSLSTAHINERIAEIKQAIQLDPLSPVFNTGLASALIEEGHLDEAFEQLQAVFAMDPQFARAHGILGDVYTLQGKYREGIAAYHTSTALGGGLPLGSIGYAYARSGDRKHALQILAQLYDLEKEGDDYSYDLAMVEAALGNHQRAIEWLQKSYDAHNDDLLGLEADRSFAQLRTDPAFQEIVRKINFPP